ncbi:MULTISPECIES: serine protease HtrA [Terrisporobacter]|uniref:Protease n=2 Tax=Terrisporobacter TaxID=1505652 RepID=A0A0B3VN08_9FIRM|nr:MULTISPECIES: trypsin-like peptidase domain-containing protein [Terrisporobacter]KHS58161.1 protease [Terrisporobacter othiniensis]MCC3670505.1 trypsin-like peptidase domain-containing protein [Terrisporobacter mayombei]MCR1825124.1 trypsin-like peptidase domain-containing protein [Terrisporobacter muris]MDU6986094.1 trypsin-like peptidase domain-containing protein [Terrisporobacter othiniensis]MDY3373729.1 trypsin-like peptidase domain-containing protein [Terrisporobacter othiniensis]
MSRKKGIGLVVIVAVICSVLSSFLTVVLLKNNLTSSSNGGATSQSININSAGKSTNVYQAVTEKAMPSVVGITTTVMSSNNMFSIPTESEGVGTGIVVDSNGYILTNSHVISDGEAKKVNVLFNDGSSIDGNVVWYDSQLDLAVVKVNKTGLTPAELGDSDKVSIGDISIAIGNPLGLELQRTVTQGIISGLDRTIKTESATMTGLIQTDASINSGNSGGPLLNEKGQVIGINTAKTSEGESLGFAIPINQAKEIIESVIKNGSYEKVTLGIKGYDASTYAAYAQSQGQKVATDEGIFVGEVVDDSPAKKAGVKAGDIIVKLGDTKLTSMSDLTKRLYEYKSGDKTTLVVNRDGKEVKLNVSF